MGPSCSHGTNRGSSTMPCPPAHVWRCCRDSSGAACGSCKHLAKAVACCHIRNVRGWGRWLPPSLGGRARISTVKPPLFRRSATLNRFDTLALRKGEGDCDLECVPPFEVEAGLTGGGGGRVAFTQACLGGGRAGTCLSGGGRGGGGPGEGGRGSRGEPPPPPPCRNVPSPQGTENLLGNEPLSTWKCHLVGSKQSQFIIAGQFRVPSSNQDTTNTTKRDIHHLMPTHSDHGQSELDSPGASICSGSGAGT